MKKLIFSLLFLFQIPVKFIAQVPENYNRIYTKTYLETSQQDFNKALKVADSLFKISETPLFKTRSLMLSASLYQQSGDIKIAIDYAIMAEKEINNTDELVWKAKILGFLSTQYRILGLFSQSKKYISKTMELISEMEDPKMKNSVMGFALQEQAYYETEIKNYKKSLSLIHKAQYYFNANQQNNAFLRAQNEQLLGLNYYYLEKYDKALYYYNKALQKLNQMPENHLKGLVFNGIAQVYIEKKNAKKAKEYIEKSVQISNKSNYLNLKNEVYKTSQKYYILTKDIESIKQVNARLDSVNEKINDKAVTFINDSYSRLEKENTGIQQKNNVKNTVIFLGALLIIFVIAYFVFYRRNQKRNFNNIKKIVDELNRQQNKKVKSFNNRVDDSDKEEEKSNLIQKPEQQLIMSPITEKRLLIKLEKFEQSVLFTRNTISLPYLASYCGTNIKYLSHVINTHKQKDFNNYINELRINYIIQKLNNDPQYHKYKISKLAEEAGFSSQSKFAAAFKKVTTVSPSQFLQHFRKEH
ncbi:helix-turn-helix domain-containing protein [Chryseobacterium sp. NRRL B-14859]|uniref:helix-turn-helix domain-containing protein n=1 Tax=Chryseobacterium sp. NRRL B-14859 TaxID=1562763 RepID=UPI0033917018